MLYTMMVNIWHSLPVELLLLVKTGSYAGKHQTLLQRILHSLLFPLVQVKQWTGDLCAQDRLSTALENCITKQSHLIQVLIGKNNQEACSQPAKNLEQSIISTFNPPETMLVFGSNFQHCIIIINYCYL